MQKEVWNYLSKLGYVNNETHNYFELLHEIVVGLINSEQYGILVKLCQDILEFDPQIKLIEKVVFTLINLQENKSAIAICKKYLELNANHEIVIAILKEFVRYQKYSNAIDTCKMYLEINHSDDLGIVRKTILEFIIRGIEYEKIFDLINYFLVLNPQNKFVYHLVYTLIESRDYSIVFDIVNLLIELDSVSFPKLYKIIKLTSDNGQSQGAAYLCEKILQKYSKSLELLVVYGYCLTNLGRFQNALDLFHDALKLVKPSDDETKGMVWSYIGRVYIGQENLQKATNACIKSLKLNHKIPETYSNLGFLYWKKGYIERGIKLIKKGIEINENLCQAWTYLGEIYLELKNYHNAFKACFNCLSINNQFEGGRLLYKKLAKDPTIILLNWILFKLVKLGYRCGFDQIDTISHDLLNKYRYVSYSKEFLLFLKRLDSCLFNNVVAIYSWLPTCDFCKDILKLYGERVNYKSGYRTKLYRCSTCGWEKEEDHPLEVIDKSYLKVRVVVNSLSSLPNHNQSHFRVSKLDYEKIFLTCSDLESFRNTATPKFQNAVLLYGKDIRK